MTRNRAIGGSLIVALRLVGALIGVGATVAAVLIVIESHAADGGTSSTIHSIGWLGALGTLAGGLVVALALCWAASVLECLSELEFRSRLQEFALQSQLEEHSVAFASPTPVQPTN